ncbi:MAG: hypothetical protein H5U02_08750 [Clostridia bacterium]|nr:hypothetical protein [Clostridia bacterium]
MGRKRVQVSMLLACAVLAAALAASCGHGQKNALLFAGSLAGRKVVMIVAHRDFRDEIGRERRTRQASPVRALSFPLSTRPVYSWQPHVKGLRFV